MSDRMWVGKGLFAVFFLILPWFFSAVSPNLQSVNSQSQADYVFGQSLHFSLLVEGGESISGVTLFFRPSDRSATTTVEIAIEEQAQGILAEHTVQLTQYRLAPFSTISYWWQVTDGAGNIWDVPVQTIDYDDDRFDWRELIEGDIIIRWTNEEAALGQTALDVVDETIPRLAGIVSVDLPKPLRIYVYPSASDLQSALRLTGRDWVGGHTNPELGVILVTAADARTAASDLRQSIPHELTHLVLFQAVGGTYSSVPRWFNEGLAVSMESDPDPNQVGLLEEAITNGTTIPFSGLCSTVPSDSRQAVLAYAQSGSMIQYIQAEYGNIALNDMILALADGADCESVSRRVLGISLTQLNEDWLQSNTPQSSPVQFLQQNFIWLLLLFASFGLTAVFFLPVKRDHS